MQHLCNLISLEIEAKDTQQVVQYADLPQGLRTLKTNVPPVGAEGVAMSPLQALEITSRVSSTALSLCAGLKYLVVEDLAVSNNDTIDFGQLYELKYLKIQITANADANINLQLPKNISVLALACGTYVHLHNSFWQNLPKSLKKLMVWGRHDGGYNLLDDQRLDDVLKPENIWFEIEVGAEGFPSKSVLKEHRIVLP
jgi:hypothetical protein